MKSNYISIKVLFYLYWFWFFRFSDPEDDSVEAPETSKDVIENKPQEKSEASCISLKPEEESAGKPTSSDKHTGIVDEIKEDLVKGVECKVEKRKPKKLCSNFNEKNEKFQYGNYNQYYGYR